MGRETVSCSVTELASKLLDVMANMLLNMALLPLAIKGLEAYSPH